MAADEANMDPWIQPAQSGQDKHPDIVIDMESSEGFVVLNGESRPPSREVSQMPSTSPEPPSDGFMDEMQSQIGKEVAGKMWQAGTQSARRAFNLYANVDLLRPYFDVEPQQVAKRLVQSLVPRLPHSDRRIQGDLYGPTVLTFTLVAVLLLTMKTSGHTVREGTLMGTAIGVSFFYWLGTSLFYYFLAYLFNSSVGIIQVLALVGYGIFGPCICLLLSLVPHSGSFFYVTWNLLAVLSALRIAFALASTTVLKRHALVLGAIACGVHLLFVVYLKLAYSKFYEAVEVMHKL